MAKSNELELQATIGTSSGLEFGTSKRNEDKKLNRLHNMEQLFVCMLNHESI